MYIVHKLEALSTLLGHSQTDGEIASYLMAHLSDITAITQQKCIQDTGVSKASIHRFYSKAGFSSFKKMMSEIDNEYRGMPRTSLDNQSYQERVINYLNDSSFNDDHISDLVKVLENANHIMLYGNQVEIGHLVNVKRFLRMHGHQLTVLNMWNIS